MPEQPYADRWWDRGWADAVDAFGSTPRARTRLMLTSLASGAYGVLFSAGVWDAQRFEMVAASAVLGVVVVFIGTLLVQLMAAPARLDAQRVRDMDIERSRHQEAERGMREEVERRLAVSREELTETIREVLAAVKGSPASVVPSAAQAPVMEDVRLTVAAVEAGLGTLDYSDAEIEKYAPGCLELLRAYSIRTERAWGRFIADRWMLEKLEDAYLRDLRRPRESRPGLPLVDPIGLCAWGPRLHLPPDPEKEPALEDVRARLRKMRQEGAR